MPLISSSFSTRKLLFNSKSLTRNYRYFHANMPRLLNKVYDLTSDTATQPTDEMFDLMKTAHKGDDVMEASESVNQLENYVAKLLGKEAALFCTSATLTNQLGLRVLLHQPPHSVLCDARSHIFNHECGGVAYHSQASISPVMPKNGHHLTVEDIDANLMTDVTHAPVTKVICLENTLNGSIMPLDEIKRIHAYARERDLAMHLDAARLWNASQETGISLHEYGQYFDTISICLSKGVGAPIGSILATTRPLVEKARIVRKLLGGGWRQAGFLALTAQHCIDTVVPTMKQTHGLARKLANGLQALGIELTYPCETNMLFIDTAPVGIMMSDLTSALSSHNILISDMPGTQNRIVLHYQVDEPAIDAFLKVATELVEKRKTDPRPIVSKQPATATVYR